jgi:hypothetical protein
MDKRHDDIAKARSKGLATYILTIILGITYIWLLQ